MGFKTFAILKYFLIIVFTSLIVFKVTFADKSQEIHETEYTSHLIDQGTTVIPRNASIILDVSEDAKFGWTLPSYYKQWLEYYNNVKELMANATDNSTCPSGLTKEPVESDGIWVACKDSHLPRECPISPRVPCHPIISFFDRRLNLRTIKIKLILQGLAIIRFSPPSRIRKCFYYSLRKDPFSTCEYIKVENASGIEWTHVMSMFTGYDDYTFDEFKIQLIARFKGDVVLVDKVEGMDYLLCGDNNLCATTPTGPTRSPPTTSTVSSTSEATTTGGKTDPTEDGTTTNPSLTTATPSIASRVGIMSSVFQTLVSSLIVARCIF